MAIAGFFGELPEGYYQQELFKDQLQCLSTGVKGKALTLTEYLALNHIYISPEGRIDGGSVDQMLAKQKKKRKIVASIAGFSAPAWICANPGFACTLPAKLYCEKKNLVARDLPFSTPEIRVVQVWHQRTHRDPLFRFVRGVIREVCASS